MKWLIQVIAAVGAAVLTVLLKHYSSVKGVIYAPKNQDRTDDIVADIDRMRADAHEASRRSNADTGEQIEGEGGGGG